MLNPWVNLPDEEPFVLPCDDAGVRAFNATATNIYRLRLDVMPESLSHMESLAIYFPSVIKDEAVMRIHWGTTGVPIHIKAPYRPPSP